MSGVRTRLGSAVSGWQARLRCAMGSRWRPPALAIPLHRSRELSLLAAIRQLPVAWFHRSGRLSISVKAMAASSILLLCILWIGLSGYVTADRSASGLSELSNVELPKQRAISELTADIIATHLKIFRHVTWAKLGVDAQALDAARTEIFAELGALTDRIGRSRAQVRLSPLDQERISALSTKWEKYVREVSEVMAAVASDPSMAAMLLGATDDDFQNLAGEFRTISTLLANQARTTSRYLAASAQHSRITLVLVGLIGVLTSALVALIVGRSIVAPIRSITRAMQDVSAETMPIDPVLQRRKDEIGQMVAAIVAFRRTMASQNKLLAEREQELRTQNMRFDVALKNMSQGLCMFDAEERLLIANDRYAEMYGLTPEAVRPGTTFRQILERRIAMGAYAGSNPEAYIDERLSAVRERIASTKIQTLADGRIVSISHQPMAEGGWVATHQDITQQRISDAKIAHMALHDALTGLPNRVLLNERLEDALTRARRSDLVATHVLDLDHFKQVNDTLGHAAGDKLLRMVADRLRALVRDVDTVARMGGDEFAIMQLAIAQPCDATALAHRIIESVSAPYDIDGHQVVIGTSIGIAMGPIDGDRPELIMRNADMALYRAKGDGRGTYRFFEQAMDTQMQARRALESDLRAALAAGQFLLHYQPIVDIASGKISGFEALIRWQHPDRGMIAPATFIPVAEETGLIIPLGEWAIREACTTAASWPDNIQIAVNLSPVQFRSPGLLQVIVDALAASGLAPTRLELEITETILLQNNDATLETLYRLRELGVRIAMDDFGTGYSSLSYLQSFPFDKIKIDRSFVRDIVDSAGSLNIVRAVAALAQGLGIMATAEGVETEAQLEKIRSEGCTEMQGFLFSKPVPADQVSALLAASKAAAADDTLAA